MWLEATNTRIVTLHIEIDSDPCKQVLNSSLTLSRFIVQHFNSSRDCLAIRIASTYSATPPPSR
nr:MAG TPA: hypothetical protein [Caudoviricetes sp.]